MRAVNYRALAVGILLLAVLCPERAPGAGVGKAGQEPGRPPAEKRTAEKGAQAKHQKVANPLNDLLDQAKRAMDDQKFEAAILPLQKVISEQPDFAYAHFQLAYVYTALNRENEARAEYERTIEADPKMAEAHLNLGILLLDRDPKAARIPLAKAVELLPSQSRPRFLLGVAEERSGELVAAAGSLEAAARLEPGDTDALLHLGTLYLQLGRPAEAEARYAAVLSVLPGDKAALSGMARCAEAQNKPEAIAAYQRYLEVEPADSGARNRYLRLLLEKGRYQEAGSELDRLAPAAPTLEILKLKADIQIGEKNWDRAALTLAEAVALAPREAPLHAGLGRIYLQKREFAAAEKELRSAIELDGKNIAYWKDLDTTFFLGGNYPAALKVLEQIEKAETPTPGSWFVKAICYDKLNQPKPALEAYQKFLELDEKMNPDQVWQAEQRSKVLKRILEGRK